MDFTLFIPSTAFISLNKLITAKILQLSSVIEIPFAVIKIRLKIYLHTSKMDSGIIHMYSYYFWTV
jgi:hypothetical protein